MRDGRNNDVLRSNLMSARVASLRHAAGCVLSKRPVLHASAFHRLNSPGGERIQG
jgi:hypothetical protein